MPVGFDPNLSLGGESGQTPDYKFVLIRQDQGRARIEFQKNGVVLFSQDTAAWDDAIPWPSGSSYALTYGGLRFGQP